MTRGITGAIILRFRPIRKLNPFKGGKRLKIHIGKDTANLEENPSILPMTLIWPIITRNSNAHYHPITPVRLILTICIFSLCWTSWVTKLMWTVYMAKIQPQPSRDSRMITDWTLTAFAIRIHGMPLNPLQTGKSFPSVLSEWRNSRPTKLSIPEIS